jgi:hypothetical protein
MDDSPIINSLITSILLILLPKNGKCYIRRYLSIIVVINHNLDRIFLWCFTMINYIYMLAKIYGVVLTISGNMISSLVNLQKS